MLVLGYKVQLGAGEQYRPSGWRLSLPRWWDRALADDTELEEQLILGRTGLLLRETGAGRRKDADLVKAAAMSCPWAGQSPLTSTRWGDRQESSFPGRDLGVLVGRGILELQHTMYGEIWSELPLSSTKRRRRRGGLAAACKSWVGWRGEDKARLFSEEHSERQQQTQEILSRRPGKPFVILSQGRSSTGSGGRSRSSFTYSSPSWTQPWATWCRWPCLGQGLDWSHRSPPTWMWPAGFQTLPGPGWLLEKRMCFPCVPAHYSPARSPR